MAITVCEALKKIRLALGGGAVTPEALAQDIYAGLALRQNHPGGFLSDPAPTWANLPSNYKHLLITVCEDVLSNDASAEIRAILDEVNDSLPEIYRA